MAGHGDGMRSLLSQKAADRLAYAIYGVCALLFLVGLGFQYFTDAWDKAHYGFEGWPGFYGIYGFVVFVFIVFAGTLLRRFVKRDEDYYEPDEPERSR